MKRVRMKSNNSSPLPTENPTTPLIQIESSHLTQKRTGFDAEYSPKPSSSPPTINSLYAEKSRFPRSKPLFRGFKRPSFSRIAIFAVLCPAAYPVFHLLTLAAKDRSLFIVRLLVSTWCSGVGFALGYIVLKIGAQHLEAASEFTLVSYRNFIRPYFKQPGPR